MLILFFFSSLVTHAAKKSKYRESNLCSLQFSPISFEFHKTTKTLDYQLQYSNKHQHSKNEYKNSLDLSDLYKSSFEVQAKTKLNKNEILKSIEQFAKYKVVEELMGQNEWQSISNHLFIAIAQKILANNEALDYKQLNLLNYKNWDLSQKLLLSYESYNSIKIFFNKMNSNSLIQNQNDLKKLNIKLKDFYQLQTFFLKNKNNHTEWINIYFINLELEKNISISVMESQNFKVQQNLF